MACGINELAIPGSGIFYLPNYLTCFMNSEMALRILRCIHLILIFLASTYFYKLLLTSVNRAILSASILTITFYPIVNLASLNSLESFVWLVVMGILKIRLNQGNGHKYWVFCLISLTIALGMFCGLPLQFRVLILGIILIPNPYYKPQKKELIYYWLSIMAGALIAYPSYIYLFERLLRVIQFNFQISSLFQTNDFILPVIGTLNNIKIFIQYNPICVFIFILGCFTKNFKYLRHCLSLIVLFFILGLLNDLFYNLYNIHSLSYLSYIANRHNLNFFYILGLMPVSLVIGLGFTSLTHKQNTHANKYALATVIFLFGYNTLGLCFNTALIHTFTVKAYLIQLGILFTYILIYPQFKINKNKLIYLSLVLLPVLFPNLCLNFKFPAINHNAVPSLLPENLYTERTLFVGMKDQANLACIDHDNIAFTNLHNLNPVTISYWGIGQPFLHKLFEECFDPNLTFLNNNISININKLKRFCYLTNSKYIYNTERNFDKPFRLANFSSLGQKYVLPLELKPMSYLSNQIKFINNQFIVKDFFSNDVNDIISIPEIDYLNKYQQINRVRQLLTNENTQPDLYSYLANFKTNANQPNFFAKAKPVKAKVVTLTLQPGHIALSTDCINPCFLIFNQSYANHWKVKIDSIDSPLFKANGYMMACFLNPGAHLIEFDFLSNWLDLIQWPTILGILIFMLLFYEAGFFTILIFLKKLAGYKV